MILLSPHYLWLLLALVPLFAVQARAYLLGRRDLIVLDQGAVDPAVQTLYLVKTFFAAFAFDLCVALCVLALADPTWGERPVEEDRQDLDIVVSVDISRSMLASDVDPDRLSRGVSVVRGASRQLESARFGVVVFKGDASVLLPLTEDVNALEAVFDGLDPNLVSTPGSDLERGVDTALDAFPQGTNAHRAIVFVSDGEGLTGSPGQSARRARDEGVPVITLVAGTTQGSTISAGDGTVLVDDSGRPVVSKVNLDVMQSLADLSGGELLNVSDVNVVGELLDELRTHVERRDAAGSRLVPVQRYRLFLALALVMLVLSVAVRVVRWQNLF